MTDTSFHERESQVAPPVRSGGAAWTAEHPMDGSWNIICNGWAFATLHYDYRYTCNAETHYRANLIAAAPDMLGALLLAETAWASALSYRHGGTPGEQREPVLNCIRAAISKATGAAS